ncbi:AbrB/MazE/SpoVT family DNA-binding domain-containing protein [Candidatus Pacearchaeota archaeon]|nr:AbrB/MazE/SpoVT family DNA-binding domain-containing protein [Candidatus Pacearchaeota archaeon]
MKILQEKSRSYKGTNYYKFKVNIPEVVLKQAKLKAGDELEVEVKDGKIILSKI